MTMQSETLELEELALAMTKIEIIAKLVDDAAHRRSAYGVAPGNSAEYSEAEMIATLQGSLEKLQAGTNIKVCGDFGDLNVECCKICHEQAPQFEMAMIDVEGGEIAWICCVLDRVLNPFKHAQSQASPEYQEFKRTINGDIISGSINEL